jgi:hypothetical protein
LGRNKKDKVPGNWRTEWNDLVDLWLKDEKASGLRCQGLSEDLMQYTKMGKGTAQKQASLAAHTFTKKRIQMLLPHLQPFSVWQQLFVWASHNKVFE